MTHEERKILLYSYYLSVVTDLVVDYPSVDSGDALTKIKDYFNSEVIDEDVELFYKYVGFDVDKSYDYVYKHILQMVGLHKSKITETLNKKYEEQERIENIKAHYLRVLRDYLKERNKLTQYSKAKDIIIEQFEKNKNFGEFVDYYINDDTLYQFPEVVDEHIYDELAILLKNRI